MSDSVYGLENIIRDLRAENERLRAALEAIANGAAGDVPSRFARHALEQKEPK